MDVPELVHMEETRAQEIGIPGAYDYGCQRISWLGNLITNWMGDDGFLKRLRAELRRFNVIGDTTWLKGKVTQKYNKEGEPLIDVECWAENQTGRDHHARTCHSSTPVKEQQRMKWKCAEHLPRNLRRW